MLAFTILIILAFDFAYFGKDVILTWVINITCALFALLFAILAQDDRAILFEIRLVAKKNDVSNDKILRRCLQTMLLSKEYGVMNVLHGKDKIAIGGELSPCGFPSDAG